MVSKFSRCFFSIFLKCEVNIFLKRILREGFAGKIFESTARSETVMYKSLRIIPFCFGRCYAGLKEFFHRSR